MNDFFRKLTLVIQPYLSDVLSRLKRGTSIDLSRGMVWAEYWENDFIKTRNYFLELKGNMPDVFEALDIRELPKKLYSSDGPYYKIQYISFFLKDVEFILSMIQNISSRIKDTNKNLDISKVFISHGPETSVLPRVEQFIRDLGLIPIVAEKTASEGREIRPDAEKKIQESHCAIILVEKDPSDPEGKNPRDNVLIEAERAKIVLDNRLIWLKEKGVELPSLDRSIIRGSFTQDCLEEAFIIIVRELRAFRLL
ncbi:hypothetical protein GF359_10800 [candidate division WOR-3 bacterium]|uniref:CD-NTase-associated protein 12/Pycsar effector protein TIR domain-containing protein n=1 Tax=candidate division WOR-3 bacterium TaxID=2052148 RepID=A0A9D5KBH6_UNCW3|nr:hypothetical protein [candidate division WOR-3 bacterium]MBD3365690.1 hypothetical protein [candidate division WOR-3 bacterium]